jgi:hypothetical protein
MNKIRRIKKEAAEVMRAVAVAEDADTQEAGRGYLGGHGGPGRGRGRGHGGGRGEPWTEAISTRWYQAHELARMTEEQR